MKSSAALKTFEPASQPTYHLPPDYALNTRLKGSLSDGLLRATSDRKVQRHPAAKIRDIVEEAMADWLRKNGYLN